MVDIKVALERLSGAIKTIKAEVQKKPEEVRRADNPFFPLVFEAANAYVGTPAVESNQESHRSTFLPQNLSLGQLQALKGHLEHFLNDASFDSNRNLETQLRAYFQSLPNQKPGYFNEAQLKSMADLVRALTK